MAISGVPYIHILDFTGGIYFIRFDIIPLHCPVFLSIAPHPLSVLVNCFIPKFRLSEKVFRISWYSPVIKSVTWISTNVFLLVLDKHWQLFSYLKTIWYNVWNVFRLFQIIWKEIASKTRFSNCDQSKIVKISSAIPNVNRHVFIPLKYIAIYSA